VAELRLEQVNSGKKVAELLTEKQWVSQIDIDQAAAEMNGIPYIFLNEVAISPEAMAFIPQSVAENYNVLAFDYDPTANALSVAMADAMDLVAIEFIEKKTRTTLKPHATNHADLMRVIRERYGVSLSSEVKQVLKDTDLGKGSGLQQAQVTQVGGVIREAPIAKIVSYVLEYAIKTRASDVHIEPLEERTRVRYRIDGILQEKLVLPRKIHGALVSRIKILSDMKIDEKRLPQDGRFAFEALQQAVDLRVSTLPTAHGEKVVMRLLKKTGGAVSLTELGMRGRALQNFNEVIIKPNGIVLVTGPTGSGKTTTLYSVLTKLNTSKVNIITLEDPIEYEIQGVNQVQVHETVGLTFASGLRSFLRQDPNIIMVGEIRDSETADLAIQAALTGHLVFSTLHTNSAAGSLPRLLDMGGEPFLLASTIGCVVGQRVARKVCPACQATFEPPVEVLADIKQVLGSLYPEGPVNLYKGKGCQECGNTGYQGMIGVFEVLMVTEKIGKLILERQPANEVEKVAIANGMVTMKQDGYLKVLEGLTTIEEVLRVAED
jgi:type IV pilus assembly protein PilB